MPPNVATGAVRSYRTVSPLPAPLLKLRRFAFCCTFRRLTPPRRYLAPRPQGARTFLPISREMQRSSGRLRRAPYRHGAGGTSIGDARCASIARAGRGQLQRARVRIIALRAGEPRGQRRGLARREFARATHRSVASSCAPARIGGRALRARDHHGDFAAREIRVAARLQRERARAYRGTRSRTPWSVRAPRRARRSAPKAALMSSRHLGDAMRRFEKHQRARFARRAPRGARGARRGAPAGILRTRIARWADRRCSAPR